MPIFGTGPKRSDGRTNSLINATLTYLTPNEVPNLTVWFDAADISTIRTNISSLNQWYSKTSISSVMSNAFGLPGPIWRSTTQNGLPVVRFNGTNSSFMSSISMTYNANTYVTNNETTIFLAYNPTNNGAPFGVTTNVYGGDGIRLHPQCGQNWFFGNIFNSPSNARLDYSYPTGTGFKVESYFGRQSTLGVRLNGSLFTQSTMATGLSFPAGTNYHVQMGGVGYGSRLFTQDIGEALIYNRGLSDYELRGVEAYLARKWGTQSALPYRHPGVRTGPPLLGYRLITYPRLVSNYGLWYDAMDTSTIRDVGGNFPPLLPPNALGVGTWNDKSANGRFIYNRVTNPSQFNLMSPGTFYPAVYSPGYVSGFPTNAGYFNLRNNYGAGVSLYTGCNISAFFVLSLSPNANNNTYFALTSTANAMPIPSNPVGPNVSTFDLNLNFINNTIGFSRFGGGTNAFNNIISAPFTTNTTTLVSVFTNGNQTTVGNVLPSTNLISINGAFVSSSTTYSGNNFNLQYISMFGGYNYPANSISFFNEVAVFYRTLTSPERLLIENQLINKWKLPSNAPVSFINSLPVTSGLFGWYDAYDQTTVLRNLSNNVSMWLDKSGQSNHMSTVLCQFGSNTRSNIYYSSIGVSTNSLSALFFPSTFAIMTTSSLVTNQRFSTFSMISVGNFFKLPNGPTPRNVSLYSTFGAQDNAILGSVLDSAPGANIPVNNLNEKFSTFHINTMLVNLGTTTDTGSGILTSNAVTYFNGVSNRTTTGLIYSGMIQPSYISLMGSGLTNTPAEGDLRNNSGSLAEVLLYNRILSNTELSNVHTYLLNKWNISTLVSNVPVTRGLNLWLDAYDPATVIFSTNTNLVQQWRDKSISTLHFSNALTSGYVRPPTYTINPANNLQGLLFSNSASIYATGIYNCNFNYPVTKEATIFTVAQWSSGNASYYSPVFCMLSNNEIINNTSNNFIVVGPGNGNSVGLYRGSPGGFLGSIGNTLDRPTLVTGVFNSSFSTSVILDIPQNHVALGRNGMIGATNISSFISTLGNGLTITATDFNVNQAVLGLRAPAGGDATWFHSGFIHEVLLYNRTLSFVERQQVESYLLSKWYI